MHVTSIQFSELFPCLLFPLNCQLRIILMPMKHNLGWHTPFSLKEVRELARRTSGGELSGRRNSQSVRIRKWLLCTRPPKAFTTTRVASDSKMLLLTLPWKKFVYFHISITFAIQFPRDMQSLNYLDPKKKELINYVWHFQTNGSLQKD